MQNRRFVEETTRSAGQVQRQVKGSQHNFARLRRRNGHSFAEGKSAFSQRARVRGSEARAGAQQQHTLLGFDGLIPPDQGDQAPGVILGQETIIDRLEIEQHVARARFRIQQVFFVELLQVGGEDIKRTAAHGPRPVVEAVQREKAVPEPEEIDAAGADHLRHAWQGIAETLDAALLIELTFPGADRQQMLHVRGNQSGQLAEFPLQLRDGALAGAVESAQNRQGRDALNRPAHIHFAAGPSRPLPGVEIQQQERGHRDGARIVEEDQYMAVCPDEPVLPDDERETAEEHQGKPHRASVAADKPGTQDRHKEQYKHGHASHGRAGRLLERHGVVVTGGELLDAPQEARDVGQALTGERPDDQKGCNEHPGEPRETPKIAGGSGNKAQREQ